MNSTLRLIIIAAAMVTVLALVAGLSAESNRERERDRDRAQVTTTAPRPATPATPVVDAKVPRKDPIELKVGQTIKLLVTLEQDDSVIVDAFGFDETFAAGVPTQVYLTGVAPGTYDLELQNGGGRIGQVVVAGEIARPERQADPAPKDEQPVTPTQNPATAS